MSLGRSSYLPQGLGWPPASRYAVMPVARNVWQPILTCVARSSARRWIIRQASTRFIGFSVSVPVRPAAEWNRGAFAGIADAGGLYIGIEIGFQIVMCRHLVTLATFLMSDGPTSACPCGNSPRRAWRRRRRCGRRRRS